ncbi:MAG: hypothetical protein IKP88_00410 [Lachnospiraceae bacterium]|nr:hypothetical protein [Lachnospiraceae bacterium]
MIKKISITFLAALLLVFAFTWSNSSAAQEGKLEGIDYERIHVRSKKKGLPAYADIGGMKFKGSLKWKGKLTPAEVDEYILEYLKKNNLKLEEVIACQKAYDAYLNLDYSDDEGIDSVLERIDGVVGDSLYSSVLVDAGEKMMKGYWRFKDKEQWKESLKRFDDPYEAAEFLITDVLENSEKENITVYQAITYAESLAETAYEGYLNDLDRWKVRIDGVNAIRTLDRFYDELNEYLADQFPTGGWALTINKTILRSYTFMGVKDNTQGWTVSINLARTYSDFRGIGNPSGIYEGSASIKVSGFLVGFSNLIWNRKIGPFKENWYYNCDSMYINGDKIYNCDQSGMIDDERYLCCTDLKLHIVADLLPFGMSVATTERVVAELNLDEFEDTKAIKSDKACTISTATGFLNGDGSNPDDVVGYVIVDAAYHVESKDNESLTIVQDKGNAEFAVGPIFGPTTVDDGTKDVVTFWDRNIWAPLDPGNIPIYVNFR